MTTGAIQDNNLFFPTAIQSPAEPLNLSGAPAANGLSPALFGLQGQLNQAYQGSLQPGEQSGGASLSPIASGQSSGDSSSKYVSPSMAIILLHNYAPQLQGLVNPSAFCNYMEKEHWPGILSDDQLSSFLKTQNKQYAQLTQQRPDLSLDNGLKLMSSANDSNSLQLSVMQNRPDISYNDLDQLMGTVASIVAPINPSLVGEVQNQACNVLMSSGMSPGMLEQTYLAIASNPATQDPGQMFAAFDKVENGSITNPTQARQFLDPKPTHQQAGAGKQANQPDQNQLQPQKAATLNGNENGLASSRKGNSGTSDGSSAAATAESATAAPVAASAAPAAAPATTTTTATA